MMRCEEARKLIAEGQSAYLSPGSLLEPAADFVDRHIVECGNCQETLRRSIWAKLRRRPGPLALIRTWGTLKLVDRSVDASRLPVDYSTGGTSIPAVAYDEPPIHRVANVIMQRALDMGASELLVIHEEGSLAGEDPSREMPTEGNRPENPLAVDVRASMGTAEKLDGPNGDPRQVLAIHARVAAEWHRVQTMPDYLEPYVRARIREMAGLPISRAAPDAVGKIDLKYRGKSYTFTVHESPDQSGSPITLKRSYVPAGGDLDA